MLAAKQTAMVFCIDSCILTMCNKSLPGLLATLRSSSPTQTTAASVNDLVIFSFLTVLLHLIITSSSWLWHSIGKTRWSINPDWPSFCLWYEFSMQECKSVWPVVVICATLINTQTRHTNKQLLTSYTISSASWADVFLMRMVYTESGHSQVE